MINNIEVWKIESTISRRVCSDNYLWNVYDEKEYLVFED
jgi:hypothetical protein